MSEETPDCRPGEAALRNMQLLKHESSVFKVPKVPKKRITKKTHVLDEDEYVQGIAKIIQRDFFPDLEKLKAQNDFLEASENKDFAKLREISRKYSGSRPPTEPFNSPATFDTPGAERPFTPTTLVDEDGADSVIESTTNERTKDITDKHSLDSFLATHTSEDNASYDKLIVLEDKKRAGKLASQYEAEITSNALADAALVLPSIEQQAVQTYRPEELDTWRYRAKNFIMYVPDGVQSQRPEDKPELQYHNTRLRSLPFDLDKNKEQISAIARTQDATIAGKIGVDGSCLSAQYVPPPSPRPGEAADASPLMTWGEIEGTPFRLDGGDTPRPAAGAGAAYRMLEAGARERLALRLAERVARRRRAATPRALSATPSPHRRTNTERLASMSPAARKLAAKHLLSPRLKMTPNAMGIVPHTPKTPPIHKNPLVATPNTKKTTTEPKVDESAASGATDNNNLTDNLLQINVAKRSRLKAQDFFK